MEGFGDRVSGAGVWGGGAGDGAGTRVDEGVFLMMGGGYVSFCFFFFFLLSP